MATTTKELITTQQKAVSLRNYLQNEVIISQFEKALPKWMTPDRFLRVVFTSSMKNPKIFDCTKESILSALMQCAQLGLEPILGRAHLIPYRNSYGVGEAKTYRMELQFQPGYQGLIDLAMRTGEYAGISAHVVYEKDYFELKYGMDEDLVHTPSRPPRGDPIGAYTVWKTKDGGRNFSFMYIEEIYARHRDRSEGFKGALKTLEESKSKKWTNYVSKNPWLNDDLHAMLKKSVIKAHAKFERASVDFMKAVELDNMADIGENQYGHMLDDGLTLPEASQYDKFAAMASEKLGKPFFFDRNELATMNIFTLSSFITYCASKQQPEPIEPEEVMERVQDQQAFDNLYSAFMRWYVKESPGFHANTNQAPSTGQPTQIAGSEMDGADNPFDINWSKNKFSEPGVKKFWEANEKFFTEAKETSRKGFRDKWVRVFTKDGVLTIPFPISEGTAKESTRETSRTNGNKVPTGKQTDVFGDQGAGDEKSESNGDGSVKLKETPEWETMDEAKGFRPDLYGKALEIYGDPQTQDTCEKISKWINEQADMGA